MSLYKIESFGDVAAENDLIKEYFVETSFVKKIMQSSTYIILGRKGTGKTAIARHYTENNGAQNSKLLSLRNYPWSLHSNIIDRGASDIEAYVSTWRYIITLQFAVSLLESPAVQRMPVCQPLISFLNKNYGGIKPEPNTILRPQQLNVSSLNISPAILGNSLGGILLTRDKKDTSLGWELNTLTDSIFDILCSILELSNVQSSSIHFDELDQGIDTIDTKRKSIITGLVLAAREFNNSIKQRSLDAKAIIYMRTDIWSALSFSDKNKITQSSSIELTWDNKSLKEVIETRLKSILKDSNARWSDIDDGKLMRGSQTKWDHIITRTFNRPRDVISFLNIALDQAKNSGNELAFKNEDITYSRNKYSNYLKSEIDDEIKQHWPEWEKGLQACSNIGRTTFNKESYAKEYDRLKSSDDFSSEKSLEYLHKFSIIGYERRSGYGGTSWAFYYTDPESGWDQHANKFKVHQGLKEYAKLKEERQVTP